MKALALNIEREQWETTTGMDILDVPEPALNESEHPEDAGQVLIRPRYTGFCGSDKGIWFRHAFKEMIFDSIEREHAPYRICGHELLGEVVDAGSYSAKAYGFKPGDIVSTESHIFCGRCHQCKIGEEHVCSDHLIIGISTNGCFADLVKLPVKELWRTDTDKIRPEVAAIQEPLGNAVHALSKVDVRGKSIAIFGCGTSRVVFDSGGAGHGRHEHHRCRSEPGQSQDGGTAGSGLHRERGPGKSGAKRSHRGPGDHRDDPCALFGTGCGCGLRNVRQQPGAQHRY